MNLSMTASSTGGQTVLEVQGEVDLHSADRLADRLTADPRLGRALGGGGPEPAVVPGLDRPRPRWSPPATAPSRPGPRCWLVCTSDVLLKLFRITGLDAVFEIHPTLAQALSAE